MKRMMIAGSLPRRGWLVLLLLVGLAAALPALALDLQQAKSQGLVGETASGYVAPVTGASPEVQALVEHVNRQRRAEYQRIARANDIAVADVEALAGKRAIERTPPGQYVNVDGRWRRK